MYMPLMICFPKKTILQLYVEFHAFYVNVVLRLAVRSAVVNFDVAVHSRLYCALHAYLIYTLT